MAENAFKPVNPDEKAPENDAAPEVTPFEPQDARPVAEPEPVENDPDSYTHYIHLADGRVLRANLHGIPLDTIGSRYYENQGEANESSAQVIGVYNR